ncbi:unnamed protein product [Rhizophagus irregularis]|uniref:Uncharacterized protein n=1 Tax=Rhizophagus irregularis TaxID=588596 RepID=A0A915ZS66_9GLOM|nr:unnamed protein product [Rhizophagus irregularis]
MQMNWSLFRMAPNQTLASATTPGTKLDKNLHYCSFSNKCYWYSQTHFIQQALIAQEMAGQGDQEGTDLLLQQFSPIENVSDKSLEEMNQYLEMIDCKNNYLLEN